MAEGGGGRSWEDIVTALSSRTVGYSGLARTIEKDHAQSTRGGNHGK